MFFYIAPIYGYTKVRDQGLVCTQNLLEHVLINIGCRVDLPGLSHGVDCLIPIIIYDSFSACYYTDAAYRNELRQFIQGKTQFLLILIYLLIIMP